MSFAMPVNGDTKVSSPTSQPKISSFFSTKRAHESESSSDLQTQGSEKRLKQSIPPEAQERMQSNLIRAKLLRLSKDLRALHPNIGLTWFEALECEFTKPYFAKLSESQTQERQKRVVFPPEDKVYSWTHFCEIRQVKVVILGQDPYHNVNQAHGLSFSVQKGVQRPPSLLNMFKELQQDDPSFCIPNHGDLTPWANQGVLLLNSCLTVAAHEANSHKDMGWEQLTDAVIKWLNQNLNHVVFMLWGAFAQKKDIMIDKSRHLVLKCAHPSPLSASRGFFGCKHFSKANTYLAQHGRDTINWNSLSNE